MAANTRNNGRVQSNHGDGKSMWSSMLDSVASGKRLPEKTLIVLGGMPETQREFLEIAASDTPRRPQDRHKRKPITANEFALGYTYQDVLDADQEDILARLSIYLLPDPSPAFAPLLKPLFTQQAIPESLVIFLLDWSEPWKWIRQIRDWVILLQNAMAALGEESRELMKQVMTEWQQHKRGPSTNDAGSSGGGNDSNVALPLSQGEWDEPLGLPLCVVCHGADKVDALELEQNWNEEDFDYILQFLRTILMKHGASLIYTSNSAPNSLPTLLHSTLGIHSLLKKQNLKHNVVDRDKVLVPPNWDSWGKIRVLREGFDVEGVSSGWSNDINLQLPSSDNNGKDMNGTDVTALGPKRSDASPEGAVLPLYESTIKPPYKLQSNKSSNDQPRLEVSVQPNQEFLAAQLEIINHLQAEEGKASQTSLTNNASGASSSSSKQYDERVNQHIGPVQVNMGGIQVDADDVVKKLKNRELDKLTKTPEPFEGGTGRTSAQTPDDQKIENERLSSFFANLAKRGVSGSPRSTPGKDARVPSGKDTPSKNS